MKGSVSKFILCLLVFSTVVAQLAKAQDISGIWRGYFITDQSDQYKLELQVNQKSTNWMDGVTYSYLSTIFYGKATAKGYFDKASKSATINEIKTVELKMSGGSVACIMKYKLTYSRSGKEEFLEGTYTSKYEKPNASLGLQSGGNCGGGKVFLRKVVTSDFYVEPFLRTKPTVKKPVVTKPLNSAPPKKTVTTKTPVKDEPKTTTKPPVKKETPIIKPQVDTVRKVTIPPVVKQEPKKIEPQALKIPATTRSRQNELVQTLTVKNREITVRLYDNGEVDGDTISVYMDNKLIVANKRSSTAPITFSLELDETNPEHTLVMVAENLGTIPPNTSLMIVHDGDKRYEVRITSTEQKNAMVRFRLQSQ